MSNGQLWIKLGPIKRSESLRGKLKFYLSVSFHISIKVERAGMDPGDLLIYTKTVNYTFSRLSLLIKKEKPSGKVLPPPQPPSSHPPATETDNNVLQHFDFTLFWKQAAAAEAAAVLRNWHS